MSFSAYDPLPPTKLYHTGIGGAGNYRKLKPYELSSSTPAPPVVKPTKRPFHGGRGGYGNTHSASERAMFSFDEELARERFAREHAAPMYSVGRGGVGNIVVEEPEEDEEDDVSLEGSIRGWRMSMSSARSRETGISVASKASGAERIMQKLKGLKKLHSS